MGTRARINILDLSVGKRPLCSIYRQMDGYPCGLGRDIQSFAKGKPLTNTWMGEKPCFNGLDCFAAQLIGALKGDRPGNVYMRSTGADSHGEEYVYNLSEKNGEIWMTVLAGGMTAFGLPGDLAEDMFTAYDGPLKDFDAKSVEEELEAHWESWGEEEANVE